MTSHVLVLVTAHDCARIKRSVPTQEQSISCRGASLMQKFSRTAVYFILPIHTSDVHIELCLLLLIESYLSECPDDVVDTTSHSS
jgi:hypothetical protein